MDRQHLDTLDPATTSTREPPNGSVPQEHTAAADEGSPPRDWSRLGRRVLAEAWRRTTDEFAARQTSRAGPVVPAPGSEEAG